MALKSVKQVWGHRLRFSLILFPRNWCNNNRRGNFFLALKVIHKDFQHAPTGAHHPTRVPH